MPATIEIQTGLTGVALTLSAFAEGSDTADFSGQELTESSNRKGCYFYSNGTATGLHKLILSAGGTPQWSAWVVLATSGTVTASETREGALLSAGIGLDGKISRVAAVDQVTSNLDKSGYGLADGAITAEKIANGAFTAAKFGSACLSAAKFATDSLTGMASAVWAHSQRLLTGFDFTIPGVEIDTTVIGSTVTESVEAALSHSSWSSSDVQQIRFQLGLDGISIPPVTAQPHLATSLSTTALAQLAGIKNVHAMFPSIVRQELMEPWIQGDSYTVAHASAIEFSRSDFPTIPEESTCRLVAQKVDDVPGSSEPFSFSISGADASILVSPGAPVLRFEATSAQTENWLPGRYEFNVTVQFPDGEERSFIGPKVYLRVLPKLAGSGA